MQSAAKEIASAQNHFRQRPWDLIKVLEQILTYFDGDIIRWPGNPVGLKTNEGRDAFREAIDFLQYTKPLPPLEWSEQLARAAADHAHDVGPKGLTGHTGSDGSSMAQRIERYCEWVGTIGENCDFGEKTAERVIAALVVDDGVPSRGHRKNIYSSEFKYVGIGTAPHKTYKRCTVFDYASGVQEKYSKGGGGGIGGGLSSVKALSRPIELKEIGGEGPAGDRIEDLRSFREGDDPHRPKHTVSSTVLVATSVKAGKICKTISKVYTMKDGTKKTVTITELGG